MIAMRFAGGGGTQADLAIGSSFEHQRRHRIMRPANISDFKLDQTFARAARHHIFRQLSGGRPETRPRTGFRAVDAHHPLLDFNQSRRAFPRVGFRRANW
jgi:hypothetical protein